MSIDLHRSEEIAFIPILWVSSPTVIRHNLKHDPLDEAQITHHAYRWPMKRKYINHWKQSLCNSQNLEFYNTFKYRYSPNWLRFYNKNPNRKALMKFTISNHNLTLKQVDKTKSTGVPDFEDETHFLFHCPGYSSIEMNFPVK